ncbi:MAG: protein-ADP-ribose hydrolase [Parasporobacterium sp.]|nr:protein-ADP-ribose hydrolase [Parasporobacterium sp.]
MTQEEKRIWLIRRLLAERKDAAGVEIPEDIQGQKDLLRGLMNIRMPDPIDDEFLKIQDEYLTEENLAEGVVKIEDLTPIKADERLYIWQGDMSRLAIDAVTLPANSGFTGCYQWLHSCLDNILGSKAGIELRLFTNEIITKQGYPEPTGQAKITPGFNLPSKYIIHTVGPIVQGRLTKENERMLVSCYRSILELADQNDIKTLALCCISTGVFMFPNQKAAEIAVETVRKWLDETGSEMKVIFNVFKDIDLMFYKYYLGETKEE